MAHFRSGNSNDNHFPSVNATYLIHFFAVFTIKDAIEVFLGVRKEEETLKAPDCRLTGFNQGNKVFIE